MCGSGLHAQPLCHPELRGNEHHSLCQPDPFIGSLGPGQKVPAHVGRLCSPSSHSKLLSSDAASAGHLGHHQTEAKSRQISPDHCGPLWCLCGRTHCPIQTSFRKLEVYGIQLRMHASFLLNFIAQFQSILIRFICRLKVPDLTPNIGLFWYFFTEMFDHFHLFFTCVFQLNPFVYVLPLAMRFRDNVPLLSFTLVAIAAIFKSYPSIGDVGFYLALLPLWNHLVPCIIIE